MNVLSKIMIDIINAEFKRRAIIDKDIVNLSNPRIAAKFDVSIRTIERCLLDAIDYNNKNAVLTKEDGIVIKELVKYREEIKEERRGLTNFKIAARHGVHYRTIDSLSAAYTREADGQ